MKQHVAQDQVAVRYADGVDHVWAAWEPALRTCERMLAGQAWRTSLDAEELAEELRRTQYRAHASSEFAAGLVPPPSARDAHAALVESLGMCRDVLGVLAYRGDLDELDDGAFHIGLAACSATRDTFRGARASTALVHAWVADDAVDPSWLVTPAERTPWYLHPSVTWMLVLLCAALTAMLVFEQLSLAAIFG